MRVLAIGAHPDDIEILCAGTLARFVDAGDQVALCVVTDGTAGHALIRPQELAHARHQEATASAALLGAEFHWLGLEDEFVFDDRATRLLFVEVVRKAHPDVVITHWTGDYHPDHRAVARLVFNATFIASLPNVHTDSPALKNVPALFYMDTLGGNGFEPSVYVDIEQAMDRKRAMLGCHTSQIEWLKDHDGVDIQDFITVVAKARGLQAGVELAEGFRREAAWGRASPTRLLP